ncbi:hypothetical protein XENTR_v10015067 [Xenopus tropicalis]|uniref:Aminopeptidase NAALADL1 n=1 Tax=Xenopus tropicalis TaxID=8364 RepID=A0A6I8Q8J6_XENTR|nr:aminopeptidase NAALADL1 [Xenopus tropicalis]KAE8605334.1 hypothetical protein XENTR_v10015067 [Xenopus tropicalis]
MNWWKVIGGVLGGAVILAAGLLIGHFGISKNTEPKWATALSRDVDEEFIQEFMKEVDTKRIEDNLRRLSLKPHVATTPADEELVQTILSHWKDANSGLDDAQEFRYDVFLSFPDKNNPNNVKVVTPEGTVKFTSKRAENETTTDQRDPDILQPYLAFAPNGTAKGKLVYANEGKVSDFQHLSEKINLTGTIAIVRYGGTGRVNKAINAAQFGVIGVIIYTDPKDINDGKSSASETYPNSWYLPPSGVERGSFKENFGDQLTPYYPAKNSTYRIKESEIKGLSPIPAQPIGFEDAKSLICNLQGPPAIDSWQGSLGCIYNIGPGFQPSSEFINSDVEVNVYNKRTIKSSANVMGIIHGSVEPDRYVMYGNHRDSWVHGAIDPSSGTAVMMEITRVLGTKLKQGKWRPRRSIIFGSWGAEEFGLVGSTEFAEEYYSKLKDRTVAYINVDISVFANASLRAQGTAPAQSVIFEASKQVKTPQGTTVYENWKSNYNRTSPQYGLIPQMGALGSGSDYAPFLHYLGITCMDIAYTYDRRVTSARIYPAYHTAFDTFDYASKFIDPGFTSHQMVGRTAGNVLLRLADSLILPLGVRDYAETLEDYYNRAEQSFQSNLVSKNISLAPLKMAINRYKKACEALEETIKELKETKETPLKIRMINDQLMLLERTFINHMAFPEQLYYSHIIWAPRSSGVATFPGLADAYLQATASNSQDDWDMVHHQLTIAIYAVESAASTLEQVTHISQR